MRVVTWNLDYLWSRTTHMEAWDYLRTVIEPDVALLQEVRPPAIEPEESLVFQRVPKTGWGTAIYSRNLSLAVIRLCEEYPGRVAGASVDLKNGMTLDLASIHAYSYPTVFPRLQRIMEMIMQSFESRRAIVGGDLNTARLAERVWPNYGHGPFWERMERSAFVDCCQRINGRELRTVFKKRAIHPFQDDHMFVSRDLASGLRDCDVIDTEVTRRVSDHIPLCIEVVV